MAKNIANLMLGIINMGVSCKSAEGISKLYRSYVRYCIQFWTPISVKGAGMLEGVRRRATKMIPSLRYLYKERLKRLDRRLRSDMTELFKGYMIEILKMIHGIDEVKLGNLFCVDEG